MSADILPVFVSTMIVVTTIVMGGLVMIGARRLARQPGVLWVGPGDAAGAARVTRVERWTAGAVALLAVAALAVTFLLGGRAAIFGLAYVSAVVAAGYLLVVRTEPGRQLLNAVPQTWLIGAQTFRVVGGVFLFAGAYGALPAYFAIPAGWGDFATGLAAPLVALAWVSGLRFARPLAWAWNVFGLLDLVVAVGIGLSYLAGPAAAIFGGSPAWLERASLGFQPFGPPVFPVGTPMTLVPTFLVPLAVLLHLLSMRKLVMERSSGDRASGRGTVGEQAAPGALGSGPA